MKHKALFCFKGKSKKELIFRLLQFLFGTLRAYLKEDVSCITQNMSNIYSISKDSN